MTRVTANTEEDVSSNIALKYVSLAKLAQSCKKRHPLPCKFDSNCRFGPICSFYHNVEHPEDTKEDSEEKKTENYEEGIDFVEDPADVNEQEKDKTTSDLCEVSSNVLQSRHVMKTHLRT